MLKPEERCTSTRASIDIELENALSRLERREVYYDRLTRDGLRDLPDTVDSLWSDQAAKEAIDVPDLQSTSPGSPASKYPAD